MTLHINTIPLGPLETNCYVLRSIDEAWLIDPGMFPEPLIGFLNAEKIQPNAILLTHGHGDHIAGTSEIIQEFPSIEVICPSGDSEMLTDGELNLSASFGVSITTSEPDKLIEPGQILDFGDTHWKVLDTSGHTPGSVSYYCEREKIVFTGDALFAGSIGRTDIPRASCGRLLDNIRRNLLSLPDDTKILPGHGPSSVIGYERKVNPFLISAT